MKTNDKILKAIHVTVLLAWLISGLYFGIAGLTRARLDETLQELDKEKETLKKDTINITYNDLSFDNKYELKYYLEIESIEKMFPWVIKISSFVSLVITAFSFSLLGSLIGIVKEIAFEDKELIVIKIWSTPILGILTGLVVFGLSYLLPTVLVKNGNELRPITLMFLCLFAGLYSKAFYEKLSFYFNKIFL